jgi:hypothetical protein
VDPGNGSYYWSQNKFFNKEKGLGYHGIYYGPGCPTKWGPKLDHKRGTNDYDYSLEPVDEVDAFAKQHDKNYDFEGYGEGFSILPKWLTDERTIGADILFVSQLEAYLERAADSEYIDKYTNNKPSAKAIKSAEQAIKYFKIIIAVKLNKIIKNGGSNKKTKE